MKYVHIFLISCLLLCSCPYEEEAEPENNALLPSSSSVGVAMPSSSSVELAEPSILGCPFEDIDTNITQYYPLPEFDTPNPGSGSIGYCPPSALKLSAEELSFNAQGGVRCITSKSLMAVDGKGCYEERIVRFLPDGSTFTGTRQKFKDFFGDAVQDHWGASKFYKMVCPWFTATNVDIWSEEGRRTLHISLNKNETGSERETFVRISMGNCGAGFKIIQSP
jgi:hypothetical protein